MPTTMIGLAVTLAFSLVAFTVPTSVWATGPTLTVSDDGGVHIFDRDALLARTDVVEITTSRDVAYRTPRTYRAVALAKLLEGVAIPPDAVVEAVAQDGFVTQLPRDLVYAKDDIVAYVAIEVADTPWPHAQKEVAESLAGQPSGGPRSLLIPSSLPSIRRETGKPSS